MLFESSFDMPDVSKPFPEFMWTWPYPLEMCSTAIHNYILGSNFSEGEPLHHPTPFLSYALSFKLFQIPVMCIGHDFHQEYYASYNESYLHDIYYVHIEFKI